MFGFHRIYLVPIKTAELCSELQLAPGAHQLLYFESSTTGLTETTCSRPAYEITRGMDDASAPCGDGWTEKLTNGCLKVRWIQCTWICEPPLHSSTGPGFKQISICQRWEKMVNVQSRETKIQHIIYNANWRKRVTLCLEPTTLNSRLEVGNGVRQMGFDNNTTSGDTIYLGSPTRLRGERKSRFVLQHAMNGTGNDELTQLSPAGSGFKQSILISITEMHMWKFSRRKKIRDDKTHEQILNTKF